MRSSRLRGVSALPAPGRLLSAGLACQALACSAIHRHHAPAPLAVRPVLSVVVPVFRSPGAARRQQPQAAQTARHKRRGAGRGASERQGKPRRLGRFLFFRPATRNVCAVSGSLGTVVWCVRPASGACLREGPVLSAGAAPRTEGATPPNPHSNGGCGSPARPDHSNVLTPLGSRNEKRCCSAVCRCVRGSVHDRRHSGLSSIVA